MDIYCDFNTALQKNGHYRPSTEKVELKTQLLQNIRSCLSYLLPTGTFCKNEFQVGDVLCNRGKSLRVELSSSKAGLFVDDKGYAGKIDEVTLPKLTIKTEEYRAGGMDIPINIDMGMEKLEADFTFAEYDSELFRLFGLIDGNSVSLTLRGGLQGSGSNDIEGVIINLRGIFREFDFGSWKPAEKATLKCTVAAHYYKLTIGARELIEIDAENMIRKINGVD